MVAMEVAAAKATEEPREGRARQKARKAASQTVRTGERKRPSTLWKNCGWNRMSILKHRFQEWEETYDSAISCKGKHHSRVRGHGEQPAMPYANHDHAHKDHCTVVSKNINKNLQYWLADGTRDSAVEILDAEEEREQHEESE